MQDRFAESISEAKAAADTRLLGDFTGIYCRGNHRDAARAPLASDGVEVGVYGRRTPVVCDECAELLRYAEQRRAFCPKDPKPFCSTCDTHCYRPAMREHMRDVMRYAGPRSMFHGYAIQGVRHLLESRAARKAAGATRASDTEG
jgi:hypothetical protein